MSENEDNSPGQSLYDQGMKYNWRAAESPSNTMLARAIFERAAVEKHTKALRELSEMMFVGAGGSLEPERALRLKLIAFQLGDFEALEELSAMLESYAEGLIRDGDKNRAELAAEKAEQAHQLLKWLTSYIDQVSLLSHLSIGQA